MKKKQTFQNLPEDWLPDGTEASAYVNSDDEWPRLIDRLGNPRIVEHHFLAKILSWIQETYGNEPSGLSYLEVGCGHGNDLRAIKEKLRAGRFLGVDISMPEILRGLDYYGKEKNESRNAAVRLFAQGDIRNLKDLRFWNELTTNFSRPGGIKDREFNLLYLEAVLHGLGHKAKTYTEKKASAQRLLDELFRVCSPGGKFFGRANCFSGINPLARLDVLRQYNNWQFIADTEELKQMFQRAGFRLLEIYQVPHKKALTDPAKKDMVEVSFWAEK
ncbi:MAG: class I SAM-dependent methyltransferase [Patescibacteria group bacterium]